MPKEEKQYDEEGRIIRANRSALKREREQSKQFAAELLKLPTAQYSLLPIDQTLQHALVEGKRLSGNALKRHMNYLTRLLIAQDEAAIKQAHQHINHAFRTDNTKMQRIEKEINRLLDGDKEIITVLVAQYADIDIQHIRQLTRQAQQQSTSEAPNPSSHPLPNKYVNKLRRYLQNLALHYDVDTQ